MTDKLAAFAAMQAARMQKRSVYTNDDDLVPPAVVPAPALETAPVEPAPVGPAHTATKPPATTAKPGQPAVVPAPALETPSPVVPGPVQAVAKPARQSAPGKATKAKPAQPAPATPTVSVGPHQELGSDGVVRSMDGRAGQLAASGEEVHRANLTLPLFVLDSIKQWERDSLAAREQVFLERMLDCAFTMMPADITTLIEQARELAPSLRVGAPKLTGFRVRESIHFRLKELKYQLQDVGAADVSARELYAVAILNYLTAAGTVIAVPAVSPAVES